MSDHHTEPPIIVVDDVEGERELISLIFEELDLPHPVVLLSSGKALVDYMAEIRADGAMVKPPALVFLDNKMPIMSGLDAIAALRADPRNVALPVIMLTSSGDSGDVLEAYKRGANAYIVKATDFNRFRDAIACATRFWLIHNVTR